MSSTTRSTTASIVGRHGAVGARLRHLATQPLHAKLDASRFAAHAYLLSDIDRLLVDLNVPSSSVTAGRRMPAYAELQVTSNFGFLRGASHPEELVVQAQALGLAGLGAHRPQQPRRHRPRAPAGEGDAACASWSAAGSIWSDGTSLLCWPTDRPAYARLSSLLTHGKRLAAKGGCTLTLEDVLGP